MRHKFCVANAPRVSPVPNDQGGGRANVSGAKNNPTPNPKRLIGQRTDPGDPTKKKKEKQRAIIDGLGPREGTPGRNYLSRRIWPREEGGSC